jgi:hypothetical protein
MSIATTSSLLFLDMGEKLPINIHIKAAELHVQYDLSAIQCEKIKQFLCDNLQLVATQAIKEFGQSYSIKLKQNILLSFQYRHHYTVLYAP